MIFSRCRFLTILFLSILCINLSAQSYLEKGFEALQEEDYEKGMDFLKMAVSEDPDDAVAHFYLGYVYGIYGQADDALQEYTSAINKGSDNKELLPEAYYYRARVYLMNHNYQASIKDYSSALSIDGNNDTYYLSRAQAYSRMNEFTESDKDLNTVLRINSDNIQARIWLAYNEFQRGNIDKCLDQYNKIIKSHPETGEVYRLRSGIYAQKGDLTKAAADIVKALELNNPSAFNSMIQLSSIASKELSDAIENVEKVNPGEPSWKYYRAVLCESNAEYESAIELYKKANLLGPNAVIDLRIASCYYSMLEFGSALKYADDAVKKAPDDLSALSYRGEYRYDTGNIDGAIADISRIIELDPSHCANYKDRGWYKKSKRDFEGAKMDYTKAIAIDPKDASAYGSRGRIFIIQGDQEAASKDLRKAIQLDNDLDAPQDAAAFALHFLGLDEDAVSYQKQVLNAKEKNGLLSAVSFYDAACLFSLTNEKEKALYYLEQSIRNGYTRFYHFTRDTDLDNIREDDRFIALLQSYWPKSIEHLCPYDIKEDIDDFEAPKFQAGKALDFSRWISDHLNYPENARINSIQGTVVLGFYIEKDGSIGDLQVVVEQDPELDAEALRIVKNSPSWTPAIRNGEIVRYHYYCPVTFRLE